MDLRPNMTKEECIEEIKYMFGTGSEDETEDCITILETLSQEEFSAVYDLMVISYELGKEEA